MEPSSSQVPLWLDCDPGHDDFFAILLAAYHPDIRLLGISTVFGNASLEHTTRNAASILTAIAKEKEVSLHVGAAKPLQRQPPPAPTDIHGDSGLDGTELLPEPACEPSAVPALDAMAAALKAQPPGKACLVSTGALTNVAALFRRHPELVAHIKALSIMGGVLGDNFSDAPLGSLHLPESIGNVTPYAEFNIVIDPEAAADIFANDALAKKTTLIPLDLTHQVLGTAEVKRSLLRGKHGQTILRTMLVELLDFFAATYSDVFGITAGPPLHDPIAVAAILQGTPGEIPFADWDPVRSSPPPHEERFAVSVVTEGSFDEAKQGAAQTGRTVAKLLPAGQAGVRIPRSVDAAKFWSAIEECLERADEANRALAAS